jgi:Ca2+-binding RTX toxin-like protein
MSTTNFSIIANDGTVTKQADGSYLAIWGSGASLKGRLFNADGTPKAGEFNIRTEAGTTYTDISATLLSNGQTIVTWKIDGAIKALRLDADRNPVGNVMDIAATGTADQHSPKVYDLGGGKFSLTYKWLRADDDVHMLGTTTVQSDNTMTKEAQSSGDDEHHAFAVLRDGTFVIFYSNIHGQIQIEGLGGNGMPVISRTNKDAPFRQAATALDDSKCIVAWADSTAATGGTPVVKVQVMNRDGSMAGTAVSFAVPAGTIDALEVTQLADGKFVLLMTMNNGVDKDVYVASCLADGTNMKAPTLVGTSAAGNQIDPHVVGLGGAAFAVGWMDGNNTFKTEIFGANPGNEAPTSLKLSGKSVLENAVGGTHIGTLSATNGDDSSLPYEILRADGTWGTTDGRFVIERGQLKVANGALLDYEQATTHTITIRVVDQGGLSRQETFTITVGDVIREQIKGSSGNDRLVGGAGNDTLDGGAGADRMEGGAGDDLYFVDNAGDVIIETSGKDTVLTALANYVAHDGIETIITGGIRATGNVGNNAIEGNRAANVLNGVEGADTLYGEEDNDTLYGGAGDDTLDGGTGKDMLYGGLGKDVFLFDDGETGASKGKADTIVDFSRRQGDKIDLSLIDANAKKAGEQNFKFIGNKAGFSKAGEARFVKEKDATYVYLNTDNDRAAEAVIKLKGSLDVQKSWFVL